MVKSPVSSGLKTNVYRYWMYFFYWAKQFDFSESKKEYFGSNAEDKWLLKYLPEDKGRYIDIGAGHPIRGSNSYLFYRKGWVGTTIDPIYGMHLLHRIFRRKDNKILGVLGVATGGVTLYEYSPTEYSTISETRNQELIASGAMYFRKYKVKSIEVSRLNCTKDPLEPFFVSIDIEGMDLQVLSLLLKEGYRPRVICIENSNVGSEIRELLDNHRYKLMYSSGLNSIFVHKLYLREE